MRNFTLLLFITLLLTLTGCHSPLMQHTQDNIDEIQKLNKQMMQRYNTPPVVVERDAMYIDGKVKHKNGGPSWLSQHVTLNIINMPFENVAKEILRETPANTQYNDYPSSSIYKTLLSWATFGRYNTGTNVDRNQAINFSYSGTIKGALQKLAEKTDNYFTVDGDSVTWSRFEVKVFNVPFVASPFELHTDSKGTASQPTKLVSTTPSPSGFLDKIKQFYDNYFDDLKDVLPQTDDNQQLSIWNDINDTLKGIISPQGSFEVSKASAIVTVRDYPSIVNQVTRYFRQLDNELGQQVRLNIQVLEIRLNRDFSYGINWNLVRGFLNHNSISLTGDNTGLINSNNSPGMMTYSVNGGPWDQTKMIISALSQQGNLSIVTQPSVTSLNDQPAEVNITQNDSYVKSIGSLFSNVDGFAGVSVKPGDITTGFQLYILPKIIDKRVYLQISSRIASLDKMSTFATNVDDDDKQENKIQLPTISNKSFVQRSILNSGSTLVLAGFKKLTNQNMRKQYFGSETLGGRAASAENTQTIILITPVIMKAQPIDN